MILSLIPSENPEKIGRVGGVGRKRLTFETLPGSAMSDLDYRRKEYPLDYRGGERSRRERSPVSSRRPRSRSRDRYRRRDRSRSIETDRKTGSSKGRRHRSRSSGSSEVEERYGHALRILAVDFFQLSVLVKYLLTRLLALV